MRPPRHPYYSPLRYPGGKGALSNFVKALLTHNGLLDGHYAEAYGGGAAIAWSLLLGEYVRYVHVNDIDRAVYSFWVSVLQHSEDLCRLIRNTPITMSQWKRQRAILEHPNEYAALELGFAAFFLNRTNRSGIIRGGVIGGKDQESTWRMDARFNKPDLIFRITQIASKGSRITLHNLDASEFLRRILPTLPTRTLLYLDPPYYSKGKDLYEHHYAHKDHAAIARLVSSIDSHPWLVTYDAVPPVFRLYRHLQRIRYRISYSAQDRYSGIEVMFLSPHLLLPPLAWSGSITSQALNPR